jgi:predicted CopG family antitoxin
MSSKTRMISVSERTYKSLSQMGTLEDTFDSVISRMIERERIAMSGQTLAGTGQSTAIAPRSATSKGADSV